jgi:long-chain acyl-CoA synthetase
MAGIGERARATSDATALVGPGGARTFAALDRRQRALVGALHEAGVRRRDRIAILATNRVDYLEVTAGALRAGIVPVPVHHLLTPPEVAYLLEDSGARWLFTDRAFEGHPGLERTVTFGDAYERLLHEARPAELADFVAGRPMHYTSGTTGKPKGVWVEPDDRGAAARSEDFRRSWGLRDDEIHLVCSPLSHSAPHRFAVRALEAGGTVIMRDRFDPEDVLASIDLFGVTSAFMVPTHLERIVTLGARTVARYDLSSLRLVAHAGAPIRAATKRDAIAWFPFGSVWEFYGATEGRVTRISTPEWLERPGSVGMPEDGVVVNVLDDHGAPVPTGEIGEIWVEDTRAEEFSYWRDEAKTRAARRGRAWTVGDLGRLDGNGYLYLAGRKFDTIISGGVNVYPQEVEATLTDHPAVEAALVYGAPHDDWGQEVRALVTPAFGQPLDPDALDAWARERLAGFKRPRRIDVVDELPRTPTRKLKRSPN